MIRALHVEEMRRRDLHPEHDPHVLFQASTIGELIEGNYDGDLSFDELAEHGDLGLGTLNALDGEMIAIDGRFYRAELDGTLHDIEPDARTPFAVVVPFKASAELEIAEPIEHEDLLARIDTLAPDGTPSCAVRVDGHFERVHARSVPRQSKPYRQLTEVVAEQQVFELTDVEGALVGFRFPDYAQGIEVPGYHLHFITADRTRGGHVLSCRPAGVRVQVDPSSDLHMELPGGIDFSLEKLASSTREALDRVEHADGS